MTPPFEVDPAVHRNHPQGVDIALGGLVPPWHEVLQAHPAPCLHRCARATDQVLVDRVRGLHRRVVGTYATDTGDASYSASDPDLLRWVHVAFIDSFLAAHRAWGDPIPGGEDAYVREWATAGELVGVADAPRSVGELEEQIAGYTPVLRGGPAAADTVDFVRRVPIPLLGVPAYRTLFAGAVSTMRPEHRELLGVQACPELLTRSAVAATLAGLRLVLGPTSPAQQAARSRILDDSLAT